MVTPITRRSLPGNVRTYEPLSAEQGDSIVWWYGGIAKNPHAATVPKVVVFFRRLDEDDCPRAFVRREVALTHLGLLRIGTIWNQGVCTAEAEFPARHTLDLDFSEGMWDFVSPCESASRQQPPPINPTDFPLTFARDRNWLLDFPIEGGRNLLIPCTEFLARCYGRSEEVVRIVATYPWDEVERRLWAPFDQDVPKGTWPVKLRKRIRNGDTVFVAHAKYDDHAKFAAKSIYAQIEAAFGNGGPYAFVKVRPWFEGPAQIKVSGMIVNGGRTILALRINGCSDPQGRRIDRDRENASNAANPAGDDGNGKAWNGAPARILKKFPDIIDLTDQDDPEHHAAPVCVEEERFEVLGIPRTVIPLRRLQAKSSSGTPGDGGDPGSFSTGEAHGDGKGVGYASIHARPVLESHGVLRDMWEAMLYMKQSRPDLISSVEWFTFERGFCSDPEPDLVALRPFEHSPELDIPTDVRNWLYYEVRGQVPRGVLVTRLVSRGKAVFIVEIQRRPRTLTNADGSFREAEETFKGYVFVLDDPRVFEAWLEHLLSDIRHVKGIVQRLAGNCPGLAGAFKHNPANDEQVPCEAAVINALGKVGIKA